MTTSELIDQALDAIMIPVLKDLTLTYAITAKEKYEIEMNDDEAQWTGPFTEGYSWCRGTQITFDPSKVRTWRADLHYPDRTWRSCSCENRDNCNDPGCKNHQKIREDSITTIIKSLEGKHESLLITWEDLKKRVLKLDDILFERLLDQESEIYNEKSQYVWLKFTGHDEFYQVTDFEVVKKELKEIESYLVEQNFKFKWV
jgi:hypothetical protein